MPYTVTLELQDGRVHRANIPDGGGWAILASTSNPSEQTFLARVREKPAPGGLVEGRVTISNGLVPNACGCVYFRSLRLEHSARKFSTWARRGSSAGGHVLSLVDAGNHFFRSRQMLDRRFVLYSTADQRGAALACLRYQGVNWPANVPSFGPYRTKLPHVDRQAYTQLYRGWANDLLSADASGVPCYVPGFVSTLFVGPYPFEGGPLGAEAGGYRVFPTLAAWEQCWPGLLLRALVHEHVVAHSFRALHDRTTGEPVRDGARSVAYSTICAGPGQWRVEVDEFLDGGYYDKRYRYFNQGTCDYEAELWQWNRTDLEHQVRDLVVGIPLVEVAGDVGVVDFLDLLAETGRGFRWSDRSDCATLDNTPAGSYIGPSLAARLVEVAHAPHRGHSDLTREFAWVLAAGLAAQKYGRGDWSAWVAKMASFATGAQQPSGLFCRAPNTFFPAGTEGAMAFHEALVACSLVGTFRATGNATLPAALHSWAHALYTLPAIAYYGGGFGPAHNVATSVGGQPLAHLDPALCYGEGDPAHVLAAIAGCAEVSGDSALLPLQLPFWNPAPTLAARKVQLDGVFPDESQTCDGRAQLDALQVP